MIRTRRHAQNLDSTRFARQRIVAGYCGLGGPAAPAPKSRMQARDFPPALPLEPVLYILGRCPNCQPHHDPVRNPSSPSRRPARRTPPDRGRAAPPTAEVLGVPLALTDYERTMDWIDATIADGGAGYVCVAAVHTVMVCQEDEELRDAVLSSDLIVPDGQPLVWAMNALGHR